MAKQKRKDLTPVLDQWQLIDKDPIGFLVKPEKEAAFFEQLWERRPKLFRATEARRELFPTLSSLTFLGGLAEQTEGEEPLLEFGIDLNAAKYANGVRTTPNGEVANKVTLMELYQDACTLQLHQPQRWNPALWRLVAAMEQQLGCLVGANAYLTPPGTQGLAPHYDDVEIWVCQTEGSKRWRLYSTPQGFELASIPSGDFKESDIGDPIMDVTLEVGDVLYMPRGTLHQAVAQEQASCHVTISTYQKWALADLAQAMLQELEHAQPTSGASGALTLPLALKCGLPVGFLNTVGLQSEALVDTPAAGLQVAQRVAGGLRALADQIESQQELISITADRIAVDFMMTRAPPHPDQLPERGPAPSISSHVRCRGVGLFRLLPCEASEEVKEAYDGESNFVKVLSCLRNDVRGHMMGGPPGGCVDEACADPQCQTHAGSDSEGGNDEKPAMAANGAHDHKRGVRQKPGDSEEDSALEDEDEDSDEEEAADLVFPASHAGALAQLLTARESLAVKQIRLGSKEEKVGLAYSLWEEGILTTVVDSPARRKQKV